MAAVASKYTVVQFGVCVYTEVNPKPSWNPLPFATHVA